MTGESAEPSPRNDRPGGAVGEKFELLMDLLRELFQLDKGDLDFGLYRVMNLKAAEIEAFLSGDLLPQARKNLWRLTADRVEELESELEKKLVSYNRDGMDRETVGKIPWVGNKRAELKFSREGAATEGHIYNHLYQFFSRYYDGGDFMSLRRMKANGHTSYLIPYNGEEVKLYWANADQYYIKTTENFSSYVFGHDNWPAKAKVRFEIAAADTEKDNIKAQNGKDRRFVLTTREGRSRLAADGEQLVVSFDHRPLTDAEAAALPGGKNIQTRLNEETRASILQLATKLDPAWAQRLVLPAPTESNPERTVLARHLAVYTAKNIFDYFIHKDLRGFLRRELDLYLKTEIMALDDFDPDNADDQARLSRVLILMSAVRGIGGKIIDFLAQLEDFHKSIWLKKKFVLETNYGITLDKAPESLHAEVAANAAQVDEWVELYALDEIAGFTTPPPADFLRDNLHMVVDTRHFDQDFTDRLLTALADGAEDASLEEDLDGLLVYGENFQALTLLQERYRNQVECIHIDPPYNTQTSGFMYKNGYQHSSWLSMMENRIRASVAVLSEDGSFLCHIDENEYERLYFMVDSLQLFKTGTVIWDKQNPMTGGGGIAIQHEYLLWRSKSEQTVRLNNGNALLILERAKAVVQEHGGVTEKAKKEFYRWVKKSEELDGGDRGYCYIDEKGKVYGSVSLRAPEPRTDPKFFEPLAHPKTGKPCPVPPNGFSRTPETLQGMVNRGEILFGNDEQTQPRQKRYLQVDVGKQLSSVIRDGRRGKQDIARLGLQDFPYSHSVHFYSTLVGATSGEVGRGIALDFFAGSGTTAHAVMNLNREDDGSRKYIMVEMGEHFETVLLPRIKKVAYSHDWKDGKPVSREGQSQFFKYIRLESHEDALDSLEVKPLEGVGSLFEDHPELAEDYALRYQLTNETANSATLCGGDFSRPRGYTLSVVRDGARRDVSVDLPETFNYLIGLRVHARRVIENVVAITGIDAGETRCLILWRDVESTDNDVLNAWFKAHGEPVRREFNASLVYVNGDNELGRLAPTSGAWTTSALELVFREKMFETGAD